MEDLTEVHRTAGLAPAMQVHRSQARVQNLVDVRSQGGGVHRRKQPPPSQQRSRRQWGSRHGSKLGDRPAGARDRDLLAPSGAVDDIATAVTQISNADLGHEHRVSRVIQGLWQETPEGCRHPSDKPPRRSRSDACQHAGNHKQLTRRRAYGDPLLCPG
jgi:hypothetical protein